MAGDELGSPDPVERGAAAASRGLRAKPIDPESIDTLARIAGTDPDPSVRVAAVGALARLGTRAVMDRVWQAAAADPHPSVRRQAAEVAPRITCETVPTLIGLLGDDVDLVAEAAAFAIGELGDEAIGAGAVPALAAAAGGGEPLVREAAVAALGSLGDPAGLPAVLAALDDRPPVRRRAVLALAAFEGPEVEAALERARSDRDWQVRESAEDF